MAKQVIDIKKDDTVSDFKLSDGRRVEIKKGKGYHAMEAGKIANGKQEDYLPALMAQLVTIDSVPIVTEDLKFLDLKDYMAVVENFNEQNF